MQRYIRWCISAILLGALLLPATVYASKGVFVDGLGREVYIERAPQRIVSVAPHNTEILFALGLGYRIVGVTTFCDYPEEALRLPEVGGFAPFDLERVVALEPDIVFAAEIHKAEGIPALERLGIAVFVPASNTIAEMLTSIALVGEITGKSDEASQLVAGLERRIKTITEKTKAVAEAKRPRVLFVTWHDPLWVAGSETFVDDLITKAGGGNIAHDLTGWTVIDLETVIARDPQVIIVTHRADAIKNDPRLGVTEAIIEDRAYLVDGNIFQRAAPRLVKALEQLAEILHPELFQVTPNLNKSELKVLKSKCQIKSKIQKF